MFPPSGQGRPLSQEGHLGRDRETSNSQPRTDLGERLQEARAAGAKALRPNELGVFKEQGEGQCSWGRVRRGERDVSTCQ